MWYVDDGKCKTREKENVIMSLVREEDDEIKQKCIENW